jgi:hypothetical protein
VFLQIRSDTLHVSDGSLSPPDAHLALNDPLDPSANFLIFDKLALPDLSQANLYLFPEPLVVGEQIVDCFLDEFVGAAAGCGRLRKQAYSVVLPGPA